MGGDLGLMCVHCRADMTACEHPSKAEHDGWLYPHGRAGYSGVTPGMIAEAQRACPWCPDPVAPDLAWSRWSGG